MTPRKPKREERRRDATLRELLDELIQHVRNVSANAKVMPQTELDYAQDRLEWLADEIWQRVIEHRNGE